MYALVKNRASSFSAKVLDLKRDVDIKKIKDPLTQILIITVLERPLPRCSIREQLKTNRIVDVFLDDMKDEIFETEGAQGEINRDKASASF